jgi:hypothetical protein
LFEGIAEGLTIQIRRLINFKHHKKSPALFAKDWAFCTYRKNKLKI